jgi:hypothetical protein
MNLKDAYTMPCPSDMKVISEPGVPRAVSFTLHFDKAYSVVFERGMEPKKIAQILRQFANTIDDI